MAGLIVEDVCRFTIHGTFGARNIANVFDMFIAPASGVTRDDCIADQAARFVTAWADTVLDRICDTYTATSVSWVDLNDALGSVGETSTGISTDFPANGAINEPAFPGNVAVRANKQIIAARGQRKGRLYLVGANESASEESTPNQISATAVGLYNTVLDDFLDDVNVSPGGTPSYTSQMVVVHTHIEDPGPPPVIEVTGTSVVTGLLTEATLSSQRRRLRG